MNEFNTKATQGKYSITYTTDDKGSFEKVQTLCRLFIDGKNGDAIPIEWIEQQIQTVCDNIEAETFGKWLIKEWEKECSEKC